MTSVYTAIRIANDITAIEEGGVRMFLIEGTHRAMLVDTGFGGGDLAAFVRTLTDKPVFVVNTHADGDHIGANHQFAQVYMHAAEMHRYYEKGAPASAPLSLYEAYDIELGTSRWEIHLIPGHTPGSIALFDRSRGILIGGDSIQFGPIYMFGAGRCLPALIQSLIELRNKNLPITRILPSHNSMDLPDNILTQVIEGAQALLDGKLAPSEPARPLPAKQYQHGNIGFFYGE